MQMPFIEDSLITLSLSLICVGMHVCVCALYSLVVIIGGGSVIFESGETKRGGK